jgi:hypothetical protein
MKVFCNDIDSKEIIDIFFHFDEHRERYISIEWVELTKGTSSRREKPGDPMKQVVVDCIKVRGKSYLGWSGDSTNGTRYVYESDLLFKELYNWIINHQIIKRDTKLKELGI